MRSYPIVTHLFPPLAKKPREDPLRRPGAPVVGPSGKKTNKGPTPGGKGAATPQDLINFMVYGTHEDGTPEVHLSFLEDVLAGVYLKLRFETAGVRAVFVVRDQEGHRLAKAHGQQILSRLASRGLRTNTVDIEQATD